MSMDAARTGMLAPDGRCKTLDASGDGYVRAEDCIVLRLGFADASSETRVTAIVHGSAVNQVQSCSCCCLCVQLKASSCKLSMLGHSATCPALNAAVLAKPRAPEFPIQY